MKLVWCSLWEEGLATYVASTVNPGAPDEALGLTISAPLRPAVEAHKQEAICAVRARLESRDPKDYRPLFMGGGQPLSPNLPRRFGYYVGLLVVSDVGQHPRSSSLPRTNLRRSTSSSSSRCREWPTARQQSQPEVL